MLLTEEGKTMTDQAPNIDIKPGDGGRLVYDKTKRAIVAVPNDRQDKYGIALMMISQGCSDPVGVATRALMKGWHCQGCGWHGEMPNTKDIADAMGTAQVPSCPDCDQHAALYRS